MKEKKTKKVVDIKSERYYREIEKSAVFSFLAPLLKNDKETITHYEKPRDSQNII